MPFEQISSMKGDDSVSFAPESRSQLWLPAVLASQKNNLPWFPPRLQSVSLQLQVASKRVCILCLIITCSSGNSSLMACVWKCAHLQMDVSICQVEQLNANERTLPLHLGNFFFFFKWDKSALPSYELVLLTLSNLRLLIKLETACFLWCSRKDL